MTIVWCIVISLGIDTAWQKRVGGGHSVSTRSISIDGCSLAWANMFLNPPRDTVIHWRQCGHCELPFDVITELLNGSLNWITLGLFNSVKFGFLNGSLDGISLGSLHGVMLGLLDGLVHRIVLGSLNGVMLGLLNGLLNRILLGSLNGVFLGWLLHWVLDGTSLGSLNGVMLLMEFPLDHSEKLD